MTYSIPRFRHRKPQPPFALGGEYSGRPGEHYLHDALGSFLLQGPESLFTQADTGDLVVVQVLEVNGHEFKIDKVKVEVKAESTVAVPRPHAATFARFLRDVREFLLEQGLSEISTPTLVRCPGLEPSLEPFATELTRGDQIQNVYLPTSPEIHLKKAIARGHHDIFEIKTCFRRGEFSPHHENEFQMLEWYRGFANLKMIQEDLRDLVEALTEKGWFKPCAIKVTDFATLFKIHFDFELTPQSTAEDLRGLCAREQIGTLPDEAFNDLFHRLLVDRLEAEIARLGPLIIQNFPPSLAALAKFTAEGWADRFEFYWNGLEIANAFNEVNDPDEQRRRWQSEIKERERLGTSRVPIDEDLITAIKKGLPPTGGIALGVERLYMAGVGVKNIRELRLFSAHDLI